MATLASDREIGKCTGKNISVACKKAMLIEDPQWPIQFYAACALFTTRMRTSTSV